jgi:DNA-binding MarR family transcriptional regulator
MDLLLLDRLLLISELFQRDMAREFDGSSMSPARMSVLWTIHQRGPLTQQALATALDVSPRNISGLVDALEATDYVTRTAHPSDRRAHLVELNAHAKTLMERTAREHAELSATLLESVDAADRPALERGLEAITARLATLVAEAAAETGRTDTAKTGS